MAGSELTDLTPAVVGDLDDDTLLYIVTDPAGAPADKSLALSVLRDRLSGAFAPLAAGIEGTGMPEGVVTAPVGTVYRDLARTNGAVVWVKASGTGNTGWRVMWGDTGWRVLAAWDNDGNYTVGALGETFQPRPATAGGSVLIRRINDSVAIQAINISAAQAANAATDRELITGVGTLAGFRPIGGSTPVAAPLTAARIGTYRIYSDSLWWAHPVTFAEGDLVISSTPALATSLTNDGWPTTLPGTAA